VAQIVTPTVESVKNSIRSKEEFECETHSEIGKRNKQ
jgi:hypothetical protein